MTMHKALHSRDDVSELHVSRKEGKEFTGIQNIVDASIQQQEDYIRKC